MDGVEQPLLLERFPKALNRAGPVDAPRLSGERLGGDSVTQLLGDGRVVTGERCLMVVMALSLSKFLTSNRHDLYL